MPPDDLLRMQSLLMQLRLQYPDARLEPQGIPGSAPIFRCTVEGATRWIAGLPGPVVLCTSLQEARRKVLAYEVTHLSWPNDPRSFRFQAFGFSPVEGEHLPSIYGSPAKALFETHQVIRIPVLADTRTQEYLDLGNQETRLLPLALSEAFGAIAGVMRLHLSWQEPKDVDVPVIAGAVEEAPQTATASTRSLSLRQSVAAYPGQFSTQTLVAPLQRPKHAFFLRSDELLLFTPTREVAYRAHELARTLAAGYLEEKAQGRL